MERPRNKTPSISTNTPSAGTHAAPLNSPASSPTSDSPSRVPTPLPVTHTPAPVSPSAPTHNDAQNVPLARSYVLAVSADVPAPQDNLARTQETPAIVAATESRDDPDLGVTSKASQKKTPARASRRTATKTAMKTTKETAKKAATKAATKTTTEATTKKVISKKAKMCPGRYVTSLHSHSRYVYTYLDYRKLCFEDWRRSQKDGIPDSAFDDHWENLSVKAKKVRVVLGSCITSAYTLPYRLRSGMEDPGVGSGMSLFLHKLPLLTLCVYRTRTPDRVRPSKASVLSLGCFGCGRVDGRPAGGGFRVCGRVHCG